MEKFWGNKKEIKKRVECYLREDDGQSGDLDLEKKKRKIERKIKRKKIKFCQAYLVFIPLEKMLECECKKVEKD